MRALALLPLLPLLACTGKDSSDDSSPPEDTAPEASACQQRGFDFEQAWVDAEPDAALYATASDITVTTTNHGDVSLSELWTGCDTFLFIPSEPRQASSATWGQSIWERDVEALFERLPDNVHVFFVHSETPDEDLTSALQEQVDEWLAGIDAERRAWWEQHIHYAEYGRRYQPDWLGDGLADPGWGLGIDRFQRLRYIGSFADQDRYNGNVGWFAPNISMAANESIYYNFEAEREARLAADGATVLPLFGGEVLNDPSWNGQKGYAELALPADMSQFDTMVFDLTMGCEGEGEYGTCPAWDYLVYLYLCDQDDPETCDTEVGRWITTYHREGRYVHDVSALLPLLADGGTRRFAFYTQQSYEITLDVRLSNQGKEARPVSSEFLFTGGRLTETYNDEHPAIEVTVPAGATKVELATVISGHGQVDPGNCAEFCNVTHTFTVDGNEIVREYPEAGTATTCMDRASIGVVPNQYGTWWYGRNGWCPGFEVPVEVTDITDLVTPGGTVTVEYSALRNGQVYNNSGANMILSSYMVFSE
ncbi:MAG: hypothetical protein H6741_23070 [Alphaproteobacteria bacterium]|nr:hypothetical protein [Alphaproteobacteria bacterium]